MKGIAIFICIRIHKWEKAATLYILLFPAVSVAVRYCHLASTTPTLAKAGVDLHNQLPSTWQTEGTGRPIKELKCGSVAQFADVESHPLGILSFPMRLMPSGIGPNLAARLPTGLKSFLRVFGDRNRASQALKE